MAEADNEERLNRERRERIAGYEAQRRTMAESSGLGVQSEAPVEAAQSEPAPLETATRPRIKIGQIANHVTMLKQAPRYGADRDKPLPPPYVGPRPDENSGSVLSENQQASDNPDIGPTPAVYVEYNFLIKKHPPRQLWGGERKVS